MAATQLEASLRRLKRAAATATTLDAYVQALLIHANEAAVILKGGSSGQGRITRIGLAFVTEDGLVVPVPFQRAVPSSLFIDQFHVMPLRATSLGPLIASGRGDRIDDMEAHLLRRGLSLSSQVALREGIRSNVRLPWFSLERRGILWFSADTPRFFNDELFSWLESLCGDVEHQLRLLDALGPLLPTGVERPLPLERHGRALARLTRLLEVEENPAPDRLSLAWQPRPAASCASLVNLWRIDERRVLLMAAEGAADEAPDLRALLALRGRVLQLAVSRRHPARLLEALDLPLREDAEEGGNTPLPRSLALAVLHLDAGHADIATAGPPILSGESGGVLVALPGGAAPGQAVERESQVLAFGAGDRLLLAQPGAIGGVGESADLFPGERAIRLAILRLPRT